MDKYPKARDRIHILHDRPAEGDLQCPCDVAACFISLEHVKKKKEPTVDIATPPARPLPVHSIVYPRHALDRRAGTHQDDRRPETLLEMP